MKKKITCLLLCLLMLCLPLLTGCSLIEVNSDKYYNAVIVEIKNQEGKVVSKVTNRDLINGYQSMGYYYEYQGYTKAEAVDMTLNLIENRKLVILEAEEKWGIDKTGKNIPATHKTYLWEQTASSIQSIIDDYIEKEDSAEEEKDSTTIVYESYSPKAYLEIDNEGYYQIKLEQETKGFLEDYTPSVSDKDYFVDADKELLYENFFENNKYGEHFDAYKKYLDVLKENDKNLGLSNDPKSVYQREIDRIYTQHYENYLIERYTQEILNTNGETTVDAQDVLDLYSSKVRSAYTKYVLEGDSSYGDTVSEKPSDVYYYLEGQENTNYFSVLNILFNKSKTEEGKYDLIIREDDGENNYVETSNTTVTKNEIEGFVSSYISSRISLAQNSGDSEVLYDTIKDCVFMYNQDPGMQKADANYVIGVDGEGKAVSNFVESFNNAGLALYNKGAGRVGDIEIAESEYGIHVLIYTGKCENLFAGASDKFALQNEQIVEGEIPAIKLLDMTRVSPMLDKSYFDVLFDELYVDNSSKVQQGDMDVLRSNYTMVYHKGRIPASLKG